MIRRVMALCLAMMPVAAQADWYEADSKHFAVFSNDDPKHLQSYAEQLERFDKAMRVFRHVDDPPIAPVARVSVFVVKDAAQIERLSSDGVRGFYRPTIGGPVAFVPRKAESRTYKTGSRISGETSGGEYDLDADSVLRHEYTHHFMFDNYPAMALPFWFVEGYAEFHATAIFQPDGAISFGAMPSYRAGMLIDYNGVSVKDMLASDTRHIQFNDMVDLYGRGWLLIHYLTFDPTRRGQLDAYLQALNAGKKPIEAAQVFGSLSLLQRDLQKHMAQPKYLDITVKAKAIVIDPVTVRKLSDGEAATMPARIRTKAGVDPHEAATVLALARKSAAPFPADAAAQTELAEAAIDARNYDTALAAATRAIAAAPASAEKAYVLKGRAEMALARAANQTDPAVWTAIRHDFSLANHLENADPEPLMYHYASFQAVGLLPTANSKAGLYHALDLLPDVRRLRLLTVFQHIADHEYRDAEAALTPIAYAPDHGQKTTGYAADLLDALESGDATRIAAAQSALKAEMAKSEKDDPSASRR